MEGANERMRASISSGRRRSYCRRASPAYWAVTSLVVVSRDPPGGEVVPGVAASGLAMPACPSCGVSFSRGSSASVGVCAWASPRAPSMYQGWDRSVWCGRTLRRASPRLMWAARGGCASRAGVGRFVSHVGGGVRGGNACTGARIGLGSR